MNLQMGSFSLDGMVYAVKPHTKNSLSQTPNNGKSSDVNIENVMYRIQPVDTKLDFSDIRPSKYCMSQIP
jgi:hypothetical protein